MKKIFKSEYIRKTTDNRWVLVYVLTAFIAGMMTVGLFLKAYTFFTSINSQALLSPIEGIELIKPVYANEIKKEDTRWWRLYQLIRKQESNYGKMGLAVTCAKKGMINEVGYLPVKGFCFKSEWDQESTVANWINKRATYDGMTDHQLLCMWNEGKLKNTCAYAKGDLKNSK